MKKVIKRDGRIEDYDFSKVERAITKTFVNCGSIPSPKFLEQLESEMEDAFKDLDKVSVEEIHDLIQKFLIKRNKYDIVEAYILMRDKRNREREQKSKLMKGIREKLDAKNIQNQNANVDEMSFGGRMGEATRITTKEVALNDCMSDMARTHHQNNEIYIHDLDSYAVGEHNCLTVPLDMLLARGFKTKQTDVRPASSINTAMQLVAVSFQLQSLQQFGGVSASHLDWTMVPYVRKSFYKHYLTGMRYINETDDIAFKKSDAPKISIEDPYYKADKKIYDYALNMTINECHQAVEGLYHNLNTLQSRSGNQLPFSSINYGTCTLPEGRLVIKEILDVSIEGLGKFGRTSIFPCGIFQCMKGVNRKQGDPNYDMFQLALRSTAQRDYPNYCNCDTTMNNLKLDRDAKQAYLDSLDENKKAAVIDAIKDNEELCKEAGIRVVGDNLKVDQPWMPSEIYATMGCRTVNGFDVNYIDQYKKDIADIIKGEPLDPYRLKSAFQKDGRGNICPVTIILPTLAMEAKQACEKDYNNTYTQEILLGYFYNLLDQKIEVAKDMLIERFNWICKQPADSAKFMYENDTMSGYVPEEGIVSALKHGTLTIGLLGMAETTNILVGQDHTNGIGRVVASNIVKMYGDRCKVYKEKYHLNFGVYFTPAENLCYTAMKKFKKKYGVIPNVSDREFFTNSIHVPVWKEMSPFEKIDIESNWASKGNAGTIMYVELPSTTINNIEAMETLVNYAMDKDIPYFAANFPLDFCEDCGYQDEIGDVCPKCGGTHITRLRRVTGYLSTDYHNFNYGKQCETEMRVKHIKN